MVGLLIFLVFFIGLLVWAVVILGSSSRDADVHPLWQIFGKHKK